IDRWAVTARGAEVAVSSIGQAPAGIYNGYLTVLPNARALVPTVWIAPLNDPARPLARSSAVSAKDDFIDVAIGPNGDPWGTFFSPCSAEPAADAARDPACEGAYFNGGVVNSGMEGGNDRGVVGSLAFPADPKSPTGALRRKATGAPIQAGGGSGTVTGSQTW